MMERRLQRELNRLNSAFRRARLLRSLAFCWAGAAVVFLALIAIRFFLPWHLTFLWWIALAGGIFAAAMVWIRQSRRRADFQELIAMLEREHPELRHLLSTAAEQQPESESGKFHFLQLRVIEKFLTHPRRILFRLNVERKLSAAKAGHALALAGFVIALLLASENVRHSPSRVKFTKDITVSPGDTQIERGSGVVISARFGKTPPAEATLVLVSDSGKTNRVALERHLSDPVFGASLAEVRENTHYHVEYSGRKTRDYKIGVFDFPALTRADAHLSFPAYTGLTNKIIRDTLRVSAVEGTRLDYTFQLNKPVARARLISTNGEISLAIQSNGVALLNDFVLTNSGRYALELTDTEGRKNKFRSEFFFQALPDRRPELKIVFPRGDQRVSRLEELQLQAEASDDFGLLKYGIGFGVAGQEPQLLELGKTVPANQKREFSRMISLEKLGVDVDQVVCYFAWAEDYAPDGKPRRTFGDMYFAEVRPFDEIFRRDQAGADAGGNQGQGQNQQGDQRTQLAERQKQIVIATWKLQQEKGGAAIGRMP